MMLFFGLVKCLLGNPNLTFIQETHLFRGHLPGSQNGGFTALNLVRLGIILWGINFSVTYLFYILIHYLAMWSQWSNHVLGWWEHRHDPNVLFLKYEDLQKVCAFKLCLPSVLQWMTGCFLEHCESSFTLDLVSAKYTSNNSNSNENDNQN